MTPPIVHGFGKLQRVDSGCLDEIIDWHPLVDHCIDVAACFERLMQCTAIRASAERLAGRRLDDRDVWRLTAIAFLHDIGKANSGFQAKRFSKSRLPPHVAYAGHGKEAIALLSEDADRGLLEELPLIELDAWAGSAAIQLLVASVSHHGRPIRCEPPPTWDDFAPHWRPTDFHDPKAELSRLAQSLRRTLPGAFGPVSEPLPDGPRFIHFFAGLVQLADWLGSDTRFFPYADAGDADRSVFARSAAMRACEEIGIDARPSRARQRGLDFAETFSVPLPRPMQLAAGDAESGPLVIVEAETGSGKTEAALWRYRSLFVAGRVDALYFALPTRVAASQIHARVLAFCRRTFDPPCPVVVRALPGYAAADGERLIALPAFEALWADRPDDAVAHRRWAAESPKRFLAAPIAIGTIDQALLSTLQVRHAHLRHASLARSLLVIDEVHASDAYMSALTERLLDAHLQAGGEALLLSATLGARARERFIAIADRKSTGVPPDLATCAAVPYPAIHDRDGLRAVAGSPERKPIEVALVDLIDDPTWIADAAIEAARDGAKVLIVRNTVPAAVAVARLVDADPTARGWLLAVNGVPTLHHGRFSREDRPRLDAAVETVLGRQRPPGSSIVIGTQTLEQSLDIDADWLITDLCPMDVLLQRLGRLHRHRRPSEARPTAYRSARVTVMLPKRGDLSPMLAKPIHGLGRFRRGGGVYADLRILEATRRLLRAGQLEIPADNRRLVEHATHPDVLSRMASEAGADWLRHGAEVDGEAAAARSVAALQALDLDAPFTGSAFADDARIATRLGASDLVVEFADQPSGPFGQPVRTIPIRHHLIAASADAQTKPIDLVHYADGGFAFSFAGTRFSYTRFGLARDALTENEIRSDSSP